MLNTSNLQEKIKHCTINVNLISLICKEIAAKVQFIWEQDFEKEIEFVIGDEWKVSDLSYHLKLRPRWDGFTKNEILNISSQFIYLGDIFFKEILKNYESKNYNPYL
jgi:hypothetical protein